MAKYVFGIDLGTTYSCIAYVDDTMRPTVIKNKEGTSTTPSVVNFASPTTTVVGQIAKETAVIEPENTISLVKSLIGKSEFAIHYNGEDLSPSYVSSFILRKLANDAGEMLNTEVKDVVITCPAYFGTVERTATKQAGETAGLNVIEIINEPTAAALYYGCGNGNTEKTILVYDLGGGTFDVTIMRIEQGAIQVICSEGIHELGGKDWDAQVISYLEQEFKETYDFDGEFDEQAQQDLRLKAEKAKQQLTAKEDATVILEASGTRGKISLSRTTFEEITSYLLDQTIEKTDSAIEIAKSKGYSIDEILLVGGSSKMPQVKNIIKEKYNLEPNMLEPDEAVAKGAAIYAVGAYEVKVEEWKEKIESGSVDISDEAVKEEAEKYAEEAAVSIESIPQLKGRKMNEILTVATTKSYALEVFHEGLEKCCNMILKNDKIENGFVSVTKSFGTYEDNMEVVDLIVYESDFITEFYEIDSYFVLGKTTLSLPPNLPQGSPIDVTFSLNNEGILHVTGLDKTSGQEIFATMETSSGSILSKEELTIAKEKSRKITVE